MEYDFSKNTLDMLKHYLEEFDSYVAMIYKRGYGNDSWLRFTDIKCDDNNELYTEVLSKKVKISDFVSLERFEKYFPGDIFPGLLFKNRQLLPRAIEDIQYGWELVHNKDEIYKQLKNEIERRIENGEETVAKKSISQKNTENIIIEDKSKKQKTILSQSKPRRHNYEIMYRKYILANINLYHKLHRLPNQKEIAKQTRITEPTLSRLLNNQRHLAAIIVLIASIRRGTYQLNHNMKIDESDMEVLSELNEYFSRFKFKLINPMQKRANN